MTEEKDKSIVTLQFNLNIDIDKVKQFLAGACSPIVFKVMQAMQSNKEKKEDKC